MQTYVDQCRSLPFLGGRLCLVEQEATKRDCTHPSRGGTPSR